MFDDCIRNEEGKFSALHQIGQQESVLGSERVRIKHTSLDVCPCSSHSESGRVQVSNATVWLKHVLLKRDESQFFCPADQTGAIPDEPELKAIMLGRAIDR